MNIGNQIQKLRKQKDITQEILASEMGVSVAAVSKWENGNSMPDIVMLCALSDYFQVTTDELLGRCHMEKYVICDDSAFVREALYDILKKEGIQNITLAETGEQLLETFEKEIPYLVLLDINLPDKSGLELLQNIKSKYDIVKVIMITADNSDETKEKVLQLGADKFITKPFLPEQIITALETVK